MTRIIFDGDESLAFACTAIPTPQAVEWFDLSSGRQSAILLRQVGGDQISWCDPRILIGRKVIDDEIDGELATKIMVERYDLTSSVDSPLDFNSADTALIIE